MQGPGQGPGLALPPEMQQRIQQAMTQQGMILQQHMNTSRMIFGQMLATQTDQLTKEGEFMDADVELIERCLAVAMAAADKYVQFYYPGAKLQRQERPKEQPNA
jgi:hypothetical protein